MSFPNSGKFFVVNLLKMFVPLEQESYSIPTTQCRVYIGIPTATCLWLCLSYFFRVFSGSHSLSS